MAGKSPRLRVGKIAGAALGCALMVMADPAFAARAAEAPAMLPGDPMARESVSVVGPIGRPYKRPVELQVRKGARWKRVQRGRTDFEGWYVMSVDAPASAGARRRYRVIAPPVRRAGRRHARKGTRPASIRTVGQTARLTVAPAVRADEPLVVGARFTPARKGRGVLLQAHDGKEWTRLAQGEQDADGKAELKVIKPAAGALRIRVVAGSYNGARAHASDEHTIRIQPPASPAPGEADPGPPIVDETPGTPGARLISPAQVIATPDDGSASLSWTPGGGEDLAGYRVVQSATPTGPWTPVADLSADAVTADVTGLENGTAYYFQVRAASALGEVSPDGTTVGAVPVAVDKPEMTETERTFTVEPADVVDAAPGEGTQTVLTVRSGYQPLEVGDKLIVKPVVTMPEGMFAKVAAVSITPSGDTQLILDRAALDEIFVDPQFTFDADVVPQPIIDPSGDVVWVPLGGGRSRLEMRAPVKAFKCDTQHGVPISAEDAWEQTNPIPITIEIDNFKLGHVFNEEDEHLRYTLTGDRRITFHAQVKEGVTCEINPEWARHHRIFHGVIFHVGPIPLTVDVEPVLSFSVSGAVGIKIVGTSHWTLWAEKRDGLAFRAGYDSWDEPAVVKSVADVSASAFGGIHVSVKGGGGRGSANAKAGFYGEIGPELKLTPRPGCADLDLSAHIGLGVEGDLWVKRWSKELVAFDIGSKRLSSVCFGPPAIKAQMPGATTGIHYEQKLGTADHRSGTWSIAGGSLPKGLVLEGSSGRIYGVPAGPVGTTTFQARFVDSSEQEAIAPVSISVADTPDHLKALLGKIGRKDTGESWYVDKRGGRHAIPDGGTFECLKAQGIAVVTATSSEIEAFDPYENAECVRADPGDIVRTVNGDAYLVNPDWSRSWIPNGGTYECLTLDGHEIVTVPRYYVMDLPEADHAACANPDGTRGHVVKADDGSSWYVDLRGDHHWIPSGGVHECLVAQGRTTYVNVLPRGLVSTIGKRYEDAQCVRADRGDIVRHSDGDAYLINDDWTRSWIPDGGSFACLRANGHEVVAAPRYHIEDITKNAGNATMSCYVAGDVIGKAVRADDGTSYYVDKRGSKHWIPDGGTFDCIAAQAGTYQYTVPRAWLTQPEHEFAKCVRAEPGNLISTSDGDSYRINADWTRSWIPDGGSFSCLEANGHAAVRDVPRYYVEDLTASPTNATMSCYDANAVIGKVVRASDGTSYYVDKRNAKHWIPDGGTFDCIAAQVGTYQYRVPRAWLTQQETEHAKCVRAQPGNIIRHTDGDAYLVNSNWTRSWIPTGGSYNCFRAEGRTVVDAVPRYYLMDLAQAGDANFPNGTCIVRRSNGTSYFINFEGRREWIPDTPTWDCEVGRGIRVMTPGDGLVDGIAETGWHYCLNKASLHGKMLRHTDGDVHYIHPDNTRTWVPDEFTYGCRTRNGTPVVETRWRQYVNEFTDKGWDYCFNVETFKNRYIRHTDGDRYFVGPDGVRHWVPADRAACMDSRFGAAATVRWRQYVSNLAEREWAICGDTLWRNQLMDRGQWLASGNGYRLVMQTDGNLVLYNRSGSAIWNTGANGSARHLKLHNDGCLARVNFDGQWSWSVGCNQGGDRLVMQGDGNLVLYAGSRAVWASNTAGR